MNKCIYCENSFEKKTNNQKFCSDKCYTKYWNVKSKRIPVSLTMEQRQKIDVMIATFQRENLMRA